MYKIAILITVFNRIEKTIKCLNLLFANEIKVDVYLVDDGSSDGTSETISKLFPQVIIINGNGNLYWSRGMSKAWEKASKFNYDFYIWLNNDSLLHMDAIKELLNCYNKVDELSIIQGYLETEDKQHVIYTGKDENYKNLIPQRGEMKKIVFLNGNVVLIPKKVFLVLGNIDSRYHHSMGDHDYGLRALKKDINIYTTTKPIGIGEFNNILRKRKPLLSIKGRFKKLYSPLGSPPFISFYYHRKHFGLIKAISYFIKIHLINIIPDKIYNKIIIIKK